MSMLSGNVCLIKTKALLKVRSMQGITFPEKKANLRHSRMWQLAPLLPLPKIKVNLKGEVSMYFPRVTGQSDCC